MGLRGHVVRVHVPGQLHELHKGAVRGGAADREAGLLEAVAVGVVHLVAVAVALGHLGGAVGLGHHGARAQGRGEGAQAHGAAEVPLAGHDLLLLGHGGDHGRGGLRVELGGVRVLQAEDVAGVLDDHGLQAQAQTQRRDPLLAGVPQRAELALEPAHAEAAGHTHGVDVRERRRRALGGGALVRGHPADAHLGPVGEAAGAQRLGDGQVGVRQIHVLAHERHRELVLRVVHGVHEGIPRGPVHVLELQVQGLHHVGVEALVVDDAGDVVDGGGVGAVDDGVLRDVAHAGDLAADIVGDGPVRAQHDRVRLDADRAQGGHGVLGGLGLELLRGADVRHEGDVQEEDVVAADVLADLAGGLEEGLRLDVADGAADLRDDHVRGGAVAAGLRGQAHPAADLVGDVRDDLDGVPEVLAAALAGDHGGVHLAGGHVVQAVEVLVEEALVVADVQVRLGAVLGDEHLAVLERVHGARVHVEVGVELLHHHPEPARLEQVAERGGREPLAEGGGDTAGHEHVTGDARGRLSTRSSFHHGS